MRIILFDLDDTLYSRLSPFEKACCCMFDNIDSSSVFRAFNAVMKRGNEIFYDHQNGLITSEEMYIYRYCKGFEDVGIHISEKQALQFFEKYDYQLNHLQLSTEAVQMLDICKEKFISVGIISNGPSSHQRAKIQALDLHKWLNENLIIISGDYPFSKPDERIFLLAEERSSKKGKDIIYVGDSYKNDMLPAIQMGWTAIWLTTEKKQPESLQPDYTVSSISELTDLIKNIR